MEQEKKFNDKKREWENNDDVVVGFGLGGEMMTLLF